jgi:hypothetical protein
LCQPRCRVHMGTVRGRGGRSRGLRRSARKRRMISNDRS